jgi:hypothetical protein
MKKRLYLPLVSLALLVRSLLGAPMTLDVAQKIIATPTSQKITLKDITNNLNKSSQYITIASSNPPSAMSTALKAASFFNDDLIFTTAYPADGLILNFGYSGAGPLMQALGSSAINFFINNNNQGTLADFLKDVLDPSWSNAFNTALKAKNVNIDALNSHTTPSYEVAAKLLMLGENYAKAPALMTQFGPQFQNALNALQDPSVDAATKQNASTIVLTIQNSSNILSRFYVELNSLLFRAARTKGFTTFQNAFNSLDNSMKTWTSSFGFRETNLPAGLDQYYARIKPFLKYKVSKTLAKDKTLIDQESTMPQSLSGLAAQDAVVSILLHALMFHEVLDVASDGTQSPLSSQIKDFLISDLSLALKDMTNTPYLMRIAQFLDPFLSKLTDADPSPADPNTTAKHVLLMYLADGIANAQQNLNKPTPSALDLTAFTDDTIYKGTLASFIAPALTPAVQASLPNALQNSTYAQDSTLTLAASSGDGFTLNFGYTAAGPLNQELTSALVSDFTRNNRLQSLTANTKPLLAKQDVAALEAGALKLCMLMVGATSQQAAQQIDVNGYFTQLNMLMYRFYQTKAFATFANAVPTFSNTLQQFWPRFSITAYSQYTLSSVFDYYFGRMKTAFDRPLSKTIINGKLADTQGYNAAQYQGLEGKDAQDATSAILIKTIMMHQLLDTTERLSEPLRLMLVFELAHLLKDLTSSVYLQDDPNQTTYVLKTFKFIIPFLQYLGIAYTDILQDIGNMQSTLSPAQPSLADFQAFDNTEMNPSFS